MHISPQMNAHLVLKGIESDKENPAQPIIYHVYIVHTLFIEHVESNEIILSMSQYFHTSQRTKANI